MRILLLGNGKTGSMVAEVASQRKHRLQVFTSKDNVDSTALTPENLSSFEVVIDFTSPHCILSNIEAVVDAGKNMVVGTTGWYSEIDRVRKLVEKRSTGFVFSPNFSIGVNLFFEIAQTSSTALRHGYTGQIFERHHVHKKDAPSGTAMAIRNVIQETIGGDKKAEVEIVSFREGDVVGMHEIVFESDADRIYLCHDAKSRRGFAEGAVLAAEWITNRKGFYQFKDIWRQM